MTSLVCLAQDSSTSPTAGVACYLRSPYPRRTAALPLLHPLPGPAHRLKRQRPSATETQLLAEVPA